LFSRNRKNFFIVFSFIVFFIVAVVLISVSWPRYEMRFLELGILGEHKTALDYFPNDDNILSIDTEIKWFVYLHNHLGSAQDVIIRVKLINSTMEAPDDQKNLPSSQVSFIEFPLILDVDETTFLPFSWSILEAAAYEHSLSLERIMVNDEVVEVDVSDSSNSFRMVFELWVYDSSSQQYGFGWESEKGLSSASIYIGFSSNLSH